MLLLPCMSLSVSSLSNTHTPDRGPTNHYDLHLNVAHTSFHQAVRSLEAAEQPSHHSLASQNRGDNTDRRLVACNIWRPEFRAAASRTKPTTSDFRNQTPASVLPQKWNVICLGTSSQLKSTCLKLHQLQEDFQENIGALHCGAMQGAHYVRTPYQSKHWSKQRCKPKHIAQWWMLWKQACSVNIEILQTEECKQMWYPATLKRNWEARKIQ